MNTALKLTALALCLMVFAIAGFAQSTAIHPVEGTYQVTASSAEMGTLAFAIVMKKDGDKWKAEIKDAPMPLTVTSVSVDADNKVTLNADAGGSTVVIVGKYADGKLSGDWTAGDIKGQWTGTKKDAMTATAANPTASSSTVSSASSSTAPTGAAGSSAAGLEGTYDFKLVADGQGEIPLTLIIKRNGDKLVTEVQNPGDLNLTGIETKDPDVVNLTATYQGNGPIPLNGKRTGNEMGGKWEAGGFSGTWSAKKK